MSKSKNDDAYGEKEAQRRFEQALRGSREVGAASKGGNRVVATLRCI